MLSTLATIAVTLSTLLTIAWAEPLDEFLQVVERLASSREISDQERYRLLAWSDSLLKSLLADAETSEQFKQEIDELLNARLSPTNIEQFLKEFHYFHLDKVYERLGNQGHLYEILSYKETQLIEEGLNESDRNIVQNRLSSQGFDLESLRKYVVERIETFAPNLILYSGIPSVDLVPILETGLRNGVAYGPPGSHQVEQGIFTTTDFNKSLDWGLVKAKSAGIDPKNKKAAAVVELTVDENTLVFNLPKDDSAKRYVVRANYALTSLPDEVKSKLSPSAQHLVGQEFLGLMSLLKTPFFRATIFMDTGIGMGKEIVIVNRGPIKKISYLDAEKQTINVSSLKQIRSQRQKLRNQFLKKVVDLLKEEAYAKAIQWVDENAKAYGVRDPLALTVVLANLNRKQHLDFHRELILNTPKYFYIVPFLNAKLILDHELLKSTTYRESLKHWISVSRPTGVEDRLHAESSAAFFELILLEWARLGRPGSSEINELNDVFKDLGRSWSRRGLCPTLFLN